MGCVVNGPGEMADADFGYVGGAPGKINLYVGKEPVKFNIPEDEAVDRELMLTLSWNGGDPDEGDAVRYDVIMGLNYPPDWGEHTASLSPGDQTIFKPNMTFHMILGMWMDDYGFECSESFRVGKAGCETFSSVPRKLFVKG